MPCGTNSDGFSNFTEAEYRDRSKRGKDMPCNGGPRSHEESNRDYIERVEKKNDYLTRLLCDTCRRIDDEDIPYDEAVTKEVQKWYDVHKVEDDARIKEEKDESDHKQELADVKARLMKQLTTLELEALGFKVT